MRLHRFRWAQLSLQALYHSKGTPESMLKRLAELPADLDKLYTELYTSISELDEYLLVKKTLLLIMYSRVSLTATELAQAVYSTSGPELPPEHQLPALLDLCSHFVEWEEGSNELRLAHASVRDFLESMTDYDEASGHLIISQLCLQHLREYAVEKPGLQHKRWSLGHFTSYVLTQWPYHLWRATKRHHDPANKSQLDDLWSQTAACAAADRGTDPAIQKWVKRVCNKIQSALDETLSNTPASRKSPIIYGSPVGTNTPPLSASSVESFSRQSQRNGSCVSLRSDASELEGKFTNMLIRVTSQPSNPLFAFSVWKIPELIDSGLPIEKHAWDIKNERGDRAIEDLCSTVSMISLKELLWRMSDASRRDMLQRDTQFVHSAIIRDVDEGLKVEFISNLLLSGAIFKRGDGFGRSALHCAADFNLPKVIQLLVGHGAEVNAVDHNDSTPLHQACAMDCQAAAEALLGLGADFSLRDDKGRMPIFTAAEHQRWRIVRTLVELGLGRVKPCERRASHLAERDATGRTILHHAAEKGVTSIACILVKAGADVNAKVETPPENLSKLSGSSRRTVRKGRAKEGLTALHYAVLRRRREDLMEDPFNRDHSSSYSARPDEMFETLIGLGADIDAQSCDLESPLHVAARLSITCLALRLIELGADIELRNAKGESAIILAVHAANKAVVFSLIRKGANPLICDEHGRNALHYAAMGNHGESFGLFRSLLGSHGAIQYINNADKSGKTLLHHAATARWKSTFVELLLDTGVQVDAKDNDGKTAADLARVGEQLLWTRLADYLDKRAATADPLHWDNIPEGPADIRTRPPSAQSSISDGGSDTEAPMLTEMRARTGLDQNKWDRAGLYTEDYISWRLPK